MYVTLLGRGEETDYDFKVELENGSATITNLSGEGETHTYSLDGFDFIHNSLIKMNFNGNETQTLQLEGAKDDLKFEFYYQGGKIETLVYTEQQYLHKAHMPPPAKLDMTKSVISPMPGAIVSVSV